MSEPDRRPVDEFLKRTFGADINPGREDRMLREDPSLAGQVDKALRSEPYPDGVYAPITTGIPAEVPPVAYIMHNFTHKCSICHEEHRHTEMFALNHIRTGYKGVDGQMRPGSTWVRNMKPVTELRWNVPLQVHDVTTRTTVGCFACIDGMREILSTLPKPPEPKTILAAAKDPQKASEASTAQSRTKKPPSLEDFA